MLCVNRRHVDDAAATAPILVQHPKPQLRAAAPVADVPAQRWPEASSSNLLYGDVGRQRLAGAAPGRGVRLPLRGSTGLRAVPDMSNVVLDARRR
jgi:hypothetical protein